MCTHPAALQARVESIFVAGGGGGGCRGRGGMHCSERARGHSDLKIMENKI